jgi:hypothetical protein
MAVCSFPPASTRKNRPPGLGTCATSEDRGTQASWPQSPISRSSFSLRQRQWLPVARKQSYRISSCFPGAVPVLYDGRRDLALDADNGDKTNSNHRRMVKNLKH